MYNQGYSLCHWKLHQNFKFEIEASFRQVMLTQTEKNHTSL